MYGTNKPFKEKGIHDYFDAKTIEKIDDKKDIFLTKNDKIDLIKK